MIRHNAQDALLPVFLLHDPADTVSVAFVALGHVFQRFQPGLLPVVRALSCLNQPVFLCDLCL